MGFTIVIARSPFWYLHVFGMNFGLLFLPKCFKNQPKSAKNIVKITLYFHAQFLITFCSHFGSKLAPFWPPGPPGSPQGPPKITPGTPRDPLGTPRAPPGAPRSPPGPPKDTQGPPRTPFWLILAPFWHHFGPILELFGDYSRVFFGPSSPPQAMKNLKVFATLQRALELQKNALW